jgi:hypothetical protein
MEMRKTSLLRRCAITTVVLVALLQVSAFASAYVDTAPSWRDASDISTTLSIWTFSNNSKFGIQPDAGSYNPNEDPLTGDDWYATVSPSLSEKRWIPTLSGAYGVWALSGRIDAAIPNTDVTGPGTSKLIQIQLIWSPEAGYTIDTTGLTLGVTATNGDNCQTIIQAGATVDSTSIPLNNGWYQTIWTVVWPYNPTLETIAITGNVYVDSLIVDTKCIPEPATLAIMGMGVVAMLRLRKK